MTFKDNLIAKFRKFAEISGGGIFTKKARMQILGIQSFAGRESTKNDFWYDRRKNVENALIDLEIFIRFAGKGQVNQVITGETLSPIIEALLSEYDEPDAERAKIAHLLIRQSFLYLSKNKRLTRSNINTIEEAIDLSNYLAETFKPEEERYYSGHEYIPSAT